MSYDDDLYQDDFDEQKLASRLDVGLWRALFRYAAAYPGTLWGLGICAALTAVAEVSYPLLTKRVVDQVSETGLTGTSWQALQGTMVLYGLNTLLATAAIGLFIWFGGKIRTHVSHDIRAAGFANLQRLSFDFYDYRPVGWLMARMTSDCERLSNILAWGFLDLVWGLTMMAGIAGAMFVMNVKLALIALSILPLLGWISVRFQRRMLTSARQVRATNARITGSYNEAIMGVLTSKAFVRERANGEEFGELTGAMQRYSVTNHLQSAMYVPIVVTLASLATGLALAVGGGELLGGAIGAGTLIAFMAYTRHFFEPVEELGAWFAEMQMAQASAERILSLINAVPTVRDSAAVDAASATDADRIETVILEDLSFAYDPAEPVLQNINLTVARGQTVAIVGPTGGGKSTLVNLICRFYEPTGGTVRINGRDYRERSQDWLHQRLGIVLQQPHVFSGTIADNIRYGKLDATMADIQAAARTAGAHEFIAGLEQGYASEVGEGGGRLSAGQKQLVSFARAILADPQILVMDEATSSVDTVTETQIQRGLSAVLSGRLAFVIAHRLSTIRDADLILYIADGQIVERGDHHALLARRGAYYDLCQRQQGQEQPMPVSR
ncbi:MAG: ABC transporter ATP-binding protein [Pseudomonadota bacterium]